MTDRPTTLRLPYFDGAEVPFEVTPEAAAHGTEAVTRAIAAFTGLTAADRLADSLHVYNYYRDFHAAVGGEDWLDAEMGVPESPSEIWPHVTPGPLQLTVDHYAEGKPLYMVMEAECAWEEEHGLMMVWKGGAQLTKTGGYDGHVSNANAYANDKLAGVVYSASNPALTTRRD
ncbi:MAG: hypothetical protein JXQ91_19005 [Vannielia sp.]|uniref:DUF6985 domain-containing protein n=1 Tax=Vannielia sp. TaxID=2813045 RepID=UPI003B8D5897